MGRVFGRACLPRTVAGSAVSGRCGINAAGGDSAPAMTWRAYAAPSAPPAAEVAPAAAPRPDTKAAAFQVLTGPITAVVLSPDAAWMAALEKEIDLAHRLAIGQSFAVAGRQVFVLGSHAFAAGRVLYDCVAVGPAA